MPHKKKNPAEDVEGASYITNLAYDSVVFGYSGNKLKILLMEYHNTGLFALPGGFGTMDEFFEMLTWNQLKIHDKKIYVLNSDGYYNHLIHHLKQMEKEDFLYEDIEERIIFCDTPVEIFNRIG